MSDYPNDNYRVLVTGSRSFDSREIVWHALSLVEALLIPRTPLVVIEGGSSGADALAASWVEHNGLHHVRMGSVGQFPFPNARSRQLWKFRVDETIDGPWPGAGHERNTRMIQIGKPDLVLAFKDGFDYTLSQGGTENCILQTRQACIPFKIYDRTGGGMTP